MKFNNILLTGLRLINILKSLYSKDLNKKEIADSLNKKISNGTLQLDINTLYHSGFKIKRGSKANNYRYSLTDKELNFFKLNKNETKLFLLTKDILIQNVEFDKIVKLRNFCNKIVDLADEEFTEEFYDFKYFNNISDEILYKIQNALSDKSIINVTYDSSFKGRSSYRLFIENIEFYNDKLYLNCFFENSDKLIKLRADKIKSINKISNLKENTLKRKKFFYSISKEYFKNHFLEEYEQIVSINKNDVEIMVSSMNDFFIVQRILSLGKNCTKIDTLSLKQNLLKRISEIKEVYK